MSATPVAALRRPAPAVILLAGAGVLELVAVILAIASTSIAAPIVAGIGALALTAFFVLHAIARTDMQLVLRIGFAVGAIGWFIIAVHDLVLGFVPGGVGYALAGIAYVLVVVGSLVVGIWAYTSRLFDRLANIVFLIAMILGALYAFDYLIAVLPEVLFLVVWLLFAAALVVSGFFVYRRR